jgi:peptide/nickel transport system substrate-binding protein
MKYIEEDKMLKNKKIIMFLVLILVLTTAVVGCGTDGEVEEPEENEEANGDETPVDEEKTLVIAMPEEIEGTDVQQVRWDNLVHNLLYQPLAMFDLEIKDILPAEAMNYEITEDGTVITFTLAEDAKFSNGNPLTADAVKKSMERYIEISPYSYDFDPISEIVAEDDQTLVLKLENSAAFLWPVLTSVYGAPVDPSVAEELGAEAFNRDAVGNGLFMVESWEQGSKIDLVKNPNFKTYNPEVENQGPALIDKITIRFIPENFTRVSEIEAGSVDMIVGVPTENVDTLKENPDITVYEYLQTGIDYIALNPELPHLDDVNVRKAMALAINKDEINTVLNNTVKPRYGLISESQLAYDAETEEELAEEYAFDLEKAKSLLSDAGYEDTDGDGIVEKDGKDLALSMMVALDVPALKQSAPLIQSQLKQIGVDLELREYESPYIKQMIKDGEFEMATRFFWWGDPDILYYVIHSSADLPWGSETVDQLLDEARYIMDMEERTAKYSEVQKATIEEMPIIPLFSEYEYMAARNDVTGVKVGADGKRILMNDVDKE